MQEGKRKGIKMGDEIRLEDLLEEENRELFLFYLTHFKKLCKNIALYIFLMKLIF